jgi:DNA-binding CsgD family transcriptional regulator
MRTELRRAWPVKTHINHVFAKIGARDRAQAVHYAYTHGLAG